jgi:hypothetical protein
VNVALENKDYDKVNELVIVGQEMLYERENNFFNLSNPLTQLIIGLAIVMIISIFFIFIIAKIRNK